MSKISIFSTIIIITIFLFIFLLFVHKNTLDYKLTSFLKEKYPDTNVGVAVIKDNNVTVVNDGMYRLMSVFKYFIADGNG